MQFFRKEEQFDDKWNDGFTMSEVWCCTSAMYHNLPRVFLSNTHTLKWGTSFFYSICNSKMPLVQSDCPLILTAMKHYVTQIVYKL